jgi:hypothetical protein
VKLSPLSLLSRPTSRPALLRQTKGVEKSAAAIGGKQ